MSHLFRPFQTSCVLRSSSESIASRKLSMLAIFETVVVCAFLWVGVNFFNETWVFSLIFSKYSLVGAALSAPLLLLKSPQSESLGIQLMSDYWHPPSNIRWAGVSKIELLIICIFLFVLAFFSCLTLIICGNDVLPSYCFSIAVAEASIVALKGNAAFGKASLNRLRLTFFPALFGGAIAVGAFSAFVPAVAYFAIGCSVGELVVRSFCVADERRDMVDFGAFKMRKGWVYQCCMLMMAPIYMVGLFFRIFLIRVIATIACARNGLYRIQENWLENVAMVDVFAPSSVLPKATEVSESLSSVGMWGIFRRSTSFFTKSIALLGVIFCVIPAVLYRWSLKGTLWAWWPFVMILIATRSKEFNPAQKIIRAKQIIWRAHATLMIAISLVAFGMMLVFASSQSNNSIELLKVFPGEVLAVVNIFGRELGVAAFGLRWWLLAAVVIAPIVLALYAGETSAILSKELESGEIGNSPPSTRALFSERVERLEIIWGIFLFSIVQAVWWILIVKLIIAFGLPKMLIVPSWV